MKAKRVSKIARGRLAKALVMRGTKAKTSGGLTKDMLIRNKSGKIVSKKSSARAKRAYPSTLKPWSDSIQEARKMLQTTGFVAINGKSAQGKALYVKAKSLYTAKSS